LLARAHVSYEAGGLLISTGEVVDADGNVVAVGRQTALRIERRRRTSPGAEPERVLATVLFTDIVGPARRADELGHAGGGRRVAARIQTIAEPGQILVSSMVRDLVAGSGLCFFGPTAHELKGIEGEWQLCALE